jgi:hypothetical protein
MNFDLNKDDIDHIEIAEIKLTILQPLETFIMDLLFFIELKIQKEGGL